MRQRILTDCHIHAMALPSKNSLKYKNIVKKSFIRNLSYRYISNYHGLNLNDIDFNEKYFMLINDQIGQSRFAKNGIVFGLDGVYDTRGNLDELKTDFMIANDYVYDSIRRKKNLLFGASINPARKDAIRELEKAAARKAALIKVLPNTQGFAPDNKNFKKFYKLLAQKNIPLLTHSGFEFALRPLNQSYGHPDRFRMALDEGVTLIAAHGCSGGLIFFEPYKKIILNLIARYPNFYLDISALTLLTRSGIIPFLQSHPAIKDRLLFGTDFPLPVFLYPFYFRINRNRKNIIKQEKNYFDRYALLFQELGLIGQKPPLRF
ncbi:MAG: amidohydrolase family protein [Spirochaetia bacterium]|nr:amidohydrolase family protein [Spirochaetia bacterium]